MVVVGIITVLVTIAVPSFETYQARARQKEGFAMMANYFTAANAARSEYNFFPGNFVGTGFSPVGTLGYELTAGENPADLPYAQIEDPACVNLGAVCNCAGLCANYKEWIMGPMGGLGMQVGWVIPTTVGVSTANTFLISVGAVVRTKASAIDEYTMDELKNMTLVSDGLR